MPGPTRAPENTAFIADLLRLVDLWSKHPAMPGPANLGLTRVRASMPAEVLRHLADELGLAVATTAAGARFTNLQADWQLDTIWVSFHATEHDSEAPEIAADPVRTELARGTETVGPSIQDEDARDERNAHHRRYR